jgi:hypothetical protein
MHLLSSSAEEPVRPASSVVMLEGSRSHVLEGQCRLPGQQTVFRVSRCPWAFLTFSVQGPILELGVLARNRAGVPRQHGPTAVFAVLGHLMPHFGTRLRLQWCRVVLPEFSVMVCSPAISSAAEEIRTRPSLLSLYHLGLPSMEQVLSDTGE